ncbi:gamma-butyrobetaine hydroxylase-like domain-containing protein [Enterovirga sp. CN4-39]|uniref:gamma-butyrobetaine hydroxylase-like domain-containing protein n=1 Tax=Enterovirga sp. CN4-39 TaxID=3400910 RepID=UPI003C023F59
MTQDLWPTEIRLLSDKRVLAVSFEDGRRVEVPAELLRVESPSAEVQGHGPSERKLVAGKRNVRILRVDPVGNYAVRLAFDDGHSSGIYGWGFLLDMGLRQAEIMRDYEARLLQKGLDRDRPGIA